MQLLLALLPARVGLCSLALARPHGGASAQRMQEPPGALRHLVDGGLERRNVRCRRLCQAAHLADVLEGRGADLLPRGRRLEVVEDANVPAHGGHLRTDARRPPSHSPTSARMLPYNDRRARRQTAVRFHRPRRRIAPAATASVENATATATKAPRGPMPRTTASAQASGISHSQKTIRLSIVGVKVSPAPLNDCESTIP